MDAERRSILPEVAEEEALGLRRSKRRRLPPLAHHLGQRAEYETAPDGSQRLKGVTGVRIYDKTSLRTGIADFDDATNEILVNSKTTFLIPFLIDSLLKSKCKSGGWDCRDDRKAPAASESQADCQEEGAPLSPHSWIRGRGRVFVP